MSLSKPLPSAPLTIGLSSWDQETGFPSFPQSSAKPSARHTEDKSSRLAERAKEDRGERVGKRKDSAACGGSLCLIPVEF